MRNPTLTALLITLLILGLPFIHTPAVGCLLSVQLQESATLRIRYEMRITSLNGQNEGPEQIYRTIENISISSSSIDEMSIECLTCHDGLAANAHDIRVKNDPGSRVRALDSVWQSHPIGMDYKRYCETSMDFRRIDAGQNRINFIKGKVGCLSCHNPLDPKQNHLVMTDDGSALCLACHIK